MVAPPALMPSGDIHHKVEAVLNHVDDLDNIHSSMYVGKKWSGLSMTSHELLRALLQTVGRE